MKKPRQPGARRQGQRLKAHADRKAATLRKEAARYVDGRGKERATISRALAAMRRK